MTDPHITGDTALLVGWAETLARGGPGDLLPTTGQMVLYPPLATIVLWACGLLGTFLGSTLIFVKAVAMVADIGLAWLVVRMLRHRPERVRISAAAAVAFNPAFWYLSAIWGQIDSVFVLLMVASLAALHRHRLTAGWAAWAAAVLWKL